MRFVGSLTGESYPKLWVILLSLVVGFRNRGYNWLPYHLDGIFDENWLDSSYLT